jgi:high affinity choline transporter 7
MALITIGLMYASFVAIGWLATRRASGDAADFMVAGRAMPLWLATMTMTATWVDGGYLLGTAEGVYRSSIATGLQGGVCFGISLIIGGLFFARRMRALEYHTLIDPFEARFGAKWAVVRARPCSPRCSGAPNCWWPSAPPSASSSISIWLPASWCPRPW